MVEYPCPACRSTQTALLYSIEGIPTQSAVLVDDASTAIDYPTGDLALRWCGACGMAFNAMFDEARVAYNEGYEESQGASPTFQRYARSISERWIERYDLKGAHALEIGCGKGEFLELFCELSGGTGIGFDPAWEATRFSDTRREGVSFREKNFTSEDLPITTDAIICRHTLEHIGDVDGFVRLLRTACESGDVKLVAIEVPDLKRILEESAFWDIYYEHANYFTAASLRSAFERAGFEVLATHRVYGDQYLVLEARAAAGSDAGTIESAEELADTARAVELFSESVNTAIGRWRAQFEEWGRTGRKIALWGSGSKAVGFLTSIGAAHSVCAIVDINPHRSGRYMPGIPVPIIGPAALRESRPDTIVVMNAIYTEEIRADLSELGLAPMLLSAQSVPESTP